MASTETSLPRGQTPAARRGRERGALAVVAALMLTIIAIAAGAAMDFGRAYYLKLRLQQTADSASLAANAFKGVRTQETLGPIAETYFDLDTVSPKIATVTLEKKDYDEEEGTFIVEIKGVMKTSLLSLAGIPTLTVVARATSKRLPGPTEIAIALDMTVSMGASPPSTTSNVKQAKEAILQLVDQMAEGETATDEALEKVRLGIVPFNTYVNLGPAQVLAGNTGVTGIRTALWNGCAGMKAKSSDTLATLEALKFNYNYDSLCKAPNTPNPPLLSIMPIKGVKNGREQIKSTLDSIYDVSPTEWAAGRIGPFGFSYVPSGIFGAFSVLTPEEPFTTAKTPAALAAIGGQKVLILVSDGGNNHVLNPTSLQGWVMSTTDGLTLSPTRVAEANGTQKTLCDNIKQYGLSPTNPDISPVTIFVIAFRFVDSPADKEVLRYCASDPLTTFYEPTNATELKAAFHDIGYRIAKLRLVN